MRYGILFEVEVLHDHFLNLGSRVFEALDDDPAAAIRGEYSVPLFLDLRPTPETRRRMAGQQLLFKATGRGLRVGARLDPDAADDRPAVALPADLRLRFSLRVLDAAFFNYTALPESSPGFYVFGNDSGNAAAGGRFLSRPVAAFDAGRRYESGEVRAEPVATVINLFQAVRDTGPAAAPVGDDWQRIPPDTFDPAATYTTGNVVLSENQLFRAIAAEPGDNLDNAADWEPLGTLANQYVTRADGRRLRPSLFDLDLSGAALPEATVRLTAPGASDPAWEQLFVAENGNLESVQLDLRRLTPGRYDLEVLDAALAPVAALGDELYVDEQAVRAGWTGVLEIVPGSGELALLDGVGALRSPRFTLRFLSRPTRWRYIFPDPQPLGSGAEVALEAADGRVLVTPAPRPLTRYGGGIRLQDDVLVLLPEPGAERIRRQGGQWFSEIHTSNLTVTT